MIDLVTAHQTTETHDRVLKIIHDQAAAEGLPFDGDHLQVEARDGDAWLGGLTARIHQGWAVVELVAVVPEARGRDVGTRLMEEIERVARERGLSGLWLDTFSFQAPGFYARLGYEEVGRIPGYPGPHARHFMAKRLDGRPVSEGAR